MKRPQRQWTRHNSWVWGKVSDTKQQIEALKLATVLYLCRKLVQGKVSDTRNSRQRGPWHWQKCRRCAEMARGKVNDTRNSRRSGPWNCKKYCARNSRQSGPWICKKYCTRARKLARGKVSVIRNSRHIGFWNWHFVLYLCFKMVQTPDARPQSSDLGLAICVCFVQFRQRNGTFAETKQKTRNWCFQSFPRPICLGLLERTWLLGLWTWNPGNFTRKTGPSIRTLINILDVRCGAKAPHLIRVSGLRPQISDIRSQS